MALVNSDLAAGQDRSFCNAREAQPCLQNARMMFSARRM